MAGRDERAEARTANRDAHAKTTYRYGDLVVEVIPNAPAHTWGDVMVYLPHTGSCSPANRRSITSRRRPTTATSPSGSTQSTHQQMDVDVIVPGHGPVGTKKELSETRAYLELVANELRKRHAMGMSPGRAAADMNVGRFEHWTNPERNAWNAVRVYAELDGKMTPDTDTAAQNRPSPNTWRFGQSASAPSWSLGPGAWSLGPCYSLNPMRVESGSDLVLGDIVYGLGAPDRVAST